MDRALLVITVAVIAGFVTRYAVLTVDYRRYPSYPHGYLTHLALGLVAAFLGAVAVPAVVAREYTAATFLALAATQFREIRAIEREKLRALDAQELVPRGNAYIEGIARVFEARNYMAMVVSLAAGLAGQLAGAAAAGATGLVGVLLARYLRSGKELGEIARFDIVDLRFEGPDLYVGDIYIMNLALPEAREKISEWGVGILVHPRDERAKQTISNVGQRQAILHDISSTMGNRKDIETPEFTPMARKNQETGTVGLFLVPISRDREALRKALERVPVLESAPGATREALLGPHHSKADRTPR